MVEGSATYSTRWSRRRRSPSLSSRGILYRREFMRRSTRTCGTYATEKGDYVIGQLATRMNTDALVGDIVEHWLKYGESRRTVAFAVDIAHSVHIREEFLHAGVRAEHLDGST